MNSTEKSHKQEKLIMRVCHRCGHCNQTSQEPERCQKCTKAFLPLNYFTKIHDSKGEKFHTLFEEVEALEEEDLIKGLYVLW